jgi:hypothetical protein
MLHAPLTRRTHDTRRAALSVGRMGGSQLSG